MEEKYVQTELGELPESWEIERIGNKFKTQAGGTPSTKIPEYWNGIVPWINSGALKNAPIKKPSKFITEKGLKNSAAKLWPKGSVVIALTGATTGMAGFLENDFSANQSVVALLPNNKDNQKYVFYFFIFSRNELLSHCTGAAQKHINKAVIDNFDIILPKSEEQEKIVYVLSNIEEAKEKTMKKIEALKELKKSMQKHLFTYGPVPIQDVDKVELKQTEIGEIPKEWDVKKIDFIFDVQQGKQISSKESFEGKVKKPFLRTSNVFWDGIDLSKVDEMYFSEARFNKLKLEKSDILICEGGDIGRTAFVEENLDIAYQNHLYRLRKKIDNVDERYFVYWMDYAINQKGFYVFQGNRTTIPNLSAGRLKEFEMPHIKKEIEQDISSHIYNVVKAIKSEENKLNSINVLFDSMLQNLMTAKVRVNNLVIA